MLGHIEQTKVVSKSIRQSPVFSSPLKEVSVFLASSPDAPESFFHLSLVVSFSFPPSLQGNWGRWSPLHSEKALTTIWDLPLVLSREAWRPHGNFVLSSSTDPQAQKTPNLFFFPGMILQVGRGDPRQQKFGAQLPQLSWGLPIIRSFWPLACVCSYNLLVSCPPNLPYIVTGASMQGIR